MYVDRFFPEDRLFEIPVYRLSYDTYYDRLRQRIGEKVKRYLDNRPEWDTEPEEQARLRIETIQRRIYGRPYWYNEMTGVIRLYQDGGSIKGEYWGQPHRAFRWNFRHRRYEHHGRVLEYHADPVPKTSKEIYEDLLEYLTDLGARGGEFERRHVDLYSFQRVGPHVDWVAVLGWRRHLLRSGGTVQTKDVNMT